MTTTTGTSVPLEDTEEGREFLQHRLSMAGLFGAALGFVFLAQRIIETTIDRQWHEFAHPSFILHAGGTASMLAIWIVCRSGERSVPLIRTVESVGMFATCGFYTLMGSYMPSWTMPHFVVILALQGGLTARAIYVPSTAKRTLILTLASGIPMLVVTYLMYSDIDIQAYSALNDGKPLDTTATKAALGTTIFAGLWWAAAVAICSGASRVIYGLRKQVSDVRKLGQYELVEKLGEGGMGAVYRAKHAMLRRPTAVKLLPLDKAGENSITRFEKEVQQTARLTHPNTVTIFDYGRTPDGVFYYAMELLDGATLGEIVELDGPLPPARIARVLRQSAGALAEAHGAGLIHRDIKPANIMLAKQGGELDIAKVLDFGLVKELNRDVSTSLTQADSITGTPQYLSPEAVSKPDSVDARSDLYALGAVGYYMITGQHVFTGNTVVEVCTHHLHSAPEPPSQRLGGAVPEALERLVLKCLEKDPANRPQNAGELVDELRECNLGEWTDLDARRWWDDRGKTLNEVHKVRSETALGHTMDIDLARRAGIA